jgi:hypothetical protein
MEETYIAQTLSTPPPKIEEPKKLSRTKWIFIILAVITITILLIVSGIYFSGKQNIVKNLIRTPALTGVNKTNPTITPKPTVVPTENWNTYTSSNGKYSFKYPPDGSWEILSGSAVSIQCSPTDCPKPYNIYNFSVIKSDKTSLSQFISSLNTTNNNIHPYIEDYKFIKINGLDAVEVLIAGDPSLGTGPTVEVFIVIDGVGYLYSYTYLDPSLNSVTSLDQLPDPNPNILTTLTINGQTPTNTVTTADWKVYTNTTQGVTLKYPPNWFTKDEDNNNACAKFSDSADFAPPYAHTVVSVCTYSDPVQNNDNNNQITLNGYQGIQVQQTSTWGTGKRIFLPNPKGGSVEFGLLLGDINIYNLILSTFRFIQ